MREAGLVALGLLAALTVACSSPTPEGSPTPSPHRGGTLRIGAMDARGGVAELVFADPGLPTTGYLLSCCLARTPLVYPGRATVDGGTLVQPDLAVAMPEVAPNGLSWTVRLQSGIHYAPPLADQEVTAADIIRAAERAARLNPDTVDVGPLRLVVGARAFANGEAASISGLEAPDAHTLILRLVTPYGGFGILADVMWAPIPASMASGHDEDMGTNWVSSGPYMLENYPGDPTATTVALIRNPTWDPATDHRRAALVDRIEVTAVSDAAAALAKVEAGEIDFGSSRATGETVARYRADPARNPRLRTTETESIFTLPLNLAVPPFDDAAVRRAVNAVIDRSTLRDLILSARGASLGPQAGGVVVGHVFPNSQTSALLTGYDPFSSRAGHGDLVRARVEMSNSRYDSDHDGRCDNAVCQGIEMPADDGAAGESVRASLAQIGIDVTVVELTDENGMEGITHRTALQQNNFGWIYDLTGSELAGLLRGGDALTQAAQDGFTINPSLVGARSADLAAWGYSVAEVPGVDDIIDRCDRAIGYLRARCWSELDQLVTEGIAPWVPIFSLESGYVASVRVAGFSLDQSLPGNFPALDGVSLVDGP